MASHVLLYEDDHLVHYDLQRRRRLATRSAVVGLKTALWNHSGSRLALLGKCFRRGGEKLNWKAARIFMLLIRNGTNLAHSMSQKWRKSIWFFWQFVLFVDPKYLLKCCAVPYFNQCCGSESGSTGSTCFWAIRIHYSEVWIRIRLWIRIRILLSSCKNSKKNLDPTILWHFLTFYLLKIM
jgi:hypothetical protein